MYEQNPQFDERDAEILKQKEIEFNAVEGPRVGDFVFMPGEEKPRRFTHEWNATMQTTLKSGDVANHGGFYLYGESISYSGSLDQGIAKDKIKREEWIEGENIGNVSGALA